jgi:hypothetical protein
VSNSVLDTKIKNVKGKRQGKAGGQQKNEEQQSMAEEGFFVNKRNQRIFTRAWLPPALEKTKCVYADLRRPRPTSI